MKRVVSIFIAASLFILFVSCSTVESETLKFKEVEGGYALYRYEGDSTVTSFTVPSEHEGEKVVEIMDFALANQEYLKSISFGANIERIGDWAFTNCTVLTEILVDESNMNFCTFDGLLFTKDMTELLSYPNGKTPVEKDADGKVTKGALIELPESVRKIGNNAFYLCSNLWKITFNEGLEEIGAKAFLKCGNLQSFSFPKSLKTIETDAFSYCDALTTVVIPAGVTAIGDYAFFSLSSIVTEIIIERSDASGMSLGKDWIPNIKDKVQIKVPVSFIPGE